MVNPCSFCSAECCKTYLVTITAFDVLRAAKASGKRPEEFALLHEPRLLGYDPELILNTADGYGSYLLGFKSHPCIFLEENKCTIHENAPLSCRHYPYTVAKTMNARFCPFFSKIMFRLKGPDNKRKLVLDEINEYKKTVKQWNKKQGKKEDCLPFLLEKITQ